jgi:hypothetical protein
MLNGCTTRAPLPSLESDHCRAICDEIGARLAFVLQPATSDDLPPRLAELLDKLALLDQHDAPSISPSLDDMTGPSLGRDRAGRIGRSNPEVHFDPLPSRSPNREQCRDKLV